jgi:hypothetical protein
MLRGRSRRDRGSTSVGGGIDPLVAGVKETDVAEVEEAAEGEIIDTMPGAYFFAFSKKPKALKEVDRGKSSPSPS